MICKSFHDEDYRGFFVRVNEDLFFVSDEDVDRANGSIYKAVTNEHSNMPDISHRSKYLTYNLQLLAR